MVANIHQFASIRLMEDEDLPDVLRIERASYLFPWSEGIFRDCLNAGYHCLVAEVDMEVIGYAILLFGAGEAHLLNVCVAPDWRGKGHARLLLDDVCDSVRRQGVCELFLEVRPSNEVALHLYTSLGFNQVGRRPDYYNSADGREDALILALTLAYDQQLL